MRDTLFGPVPDSARTPSLVKTMNEWRALRPRHVEFFGPGRFWITVPEGIGKEVNAQSPRPPDLALIAGYALAHLVAEGYDVEMGAQKHIAERYGDGRPHYYALVAGRPSLPGDGPTLAHALCALCVVAFSAPTTTHA